VLEKTDGIGGTGSSMRTKTLKHVHAWGITNTDHPKTFSSCLEQYMKKLQKFGIEGGIVDEIKTELDSLLPSSPSQRFQKITCCSANHTAA
jgi:hypothetical protein